MVMDDDELLHLEPDLRFIHEQPYLYSDIITALSAAGCVDDGTEAQSARVAYLIS
jgi:hypothetical protein